MRRVACAALAADARGLRRLRWRRQLASDSLPVRASLAFAVVLAAWLTAARQLLRGGRRQAAAVAPLAEAATAADASAPLTDATVLGTGARVAWRVPVVATSASSPRTLTLSLHTHHALLPSRRRCITGGQLAAIGARSRTQPPVKAPPADVWPCPRARRRLSARRSNACKSARSDASGWRSKARRTRTASLVRVGPLCSSAVVLACEVLTGRVRSRPAAGKSAARGEGGQLPAAKHLLNFWFTPLVDAIKCVHVLLRPSWCDRSRGCVVRA